MVRVQQSLPAWPPFHDRDLNGNPKTGNPENKVGIQYVGTCHFASLIHRHSLGTATTLEQVDNIYNIGVYNPNIDSKGVGALPKLFLAGNGCLVLQCLYALEFSFQV